MNSPEMIGTSFRAHVLQMANEFGAVPIEYARAIHSGRNEMQAEEFLAEYLRRGFDWDPVWDFYARVLHQRDEAEARAIEKARTVWDAISGGETDADEITVLIQSSLTADNIYEFCALISSDTQRTAAIKAAHERHAENRAMRAQVFEWCDTNLTRFSSLDSAADSARRLVPVTWRTVRTWIGQWKKGQSARIP